MPACTFLKFHVLNRRRIGKTAAMLSCWCPGLWSRHIEQQRKKPFVLGSADGNPHNFIAEGPHKEEWHVSLLQYYWNSSSTHLVGLQRATLTCATHILTKGMLFMSHLYKRGSFRSISTPSVRISEWQPARFEAYVSAAKTRPTIEASSQKARSLSRPHASRNNAAT